MYSRAQVLKTKNCLSPTPALPTIPSLELHCVSCAHRVRIVACGRSETKYVSNFNILTHSFYSILFSMGKSKKHKRKRSSSSSSTDSYYLLKRIKKLEKQLKCQQATSRTRSPCVDRRQKSPSRSPRQRHCSRDSLARSQAASNTGRGVAGSVVQARELSPVNSEQSSFSILSNARSVRNNFKDNQNDESLILQDDDLLNLLGENPEKEHKNKLVLHEAITPRWRHFLLNGIKKEELVPLLENYEASSNLQELIAPRLNPEIFTVMPKDNLSKDGSLVEIQNHLGNGLCALGKGITLLLEDKHEIPKDSKEALLMHISDQERYFLISFTRYLFLEEI
ncbi:unnamed protein product [Psylliodes chrysocephalus]|uniref:Uncharacterized protein n=1 Tax=Psylliodes chrysocephalus TaxID=3402493 RepID=A0A9P0GDP4_9CUCU|nr:unnamed protein product [Psylliodes chrysocephala]